MPVIPYPRYGIDAAEFSRAGTVWAALRLFWDDDRVANWLVAINKYGHSAKNLICLSPSARRCFEMGMFALRPVLGPSQGPQIALEFCWLKHHRPRPTELCDFRTGQPLSSGRMVNVTTPDPVAIPLPRGIIFDMQWKLRRAVALSTALVDQFYADRRHAQDKGFPLGVDEVELSLEDTSSESSVSESLFDGASERYETDVTEYEAILESELSSSSDEDDMLETR